MGRNRSHVVIQKEQPIRASQTDSFVPCRARSSPRLKAMSNSGHSGFCQQISKGFTRIVALIDKHDRTFPIHFLPDVTRQTKRYFPAVTSRNDDSEVGIRKAHIYTAAV